MAEESNTQQLLKGLNLSDRLTATTPVRRGNNDWQACKTKMWQRWQTDARRL